MMSPQTFYRVKVLVDGSWVSAGDFWDLNQAKSRARIINWHLEKQVEVRNQSGRLIHSEGLVLIAEDKDTVLYEEGTWGNPDSLD